MGRPPYRVGTQKWNRQGMRLGLGGGVERGQASRMKAGLLGEAVGGDRRRTGHSGQREPS